MKFFLTGVPMEQAILERLLVGEGRDADSDAVASVVKIASGKSRSTGQGFLVSQVIRKAVEVYAVTWATYYYRAQGWTVTDVGTTDSYDLRRTRVG